MSSSSHPTAPVSTGSSSIYAAQPALPLLASSLLSAHPHHVQRTPSPTEPGVPDNVNNPTTTWNLKADFERGLTAGNRTRTDDKDDDDNSSDSYDRHVFRPGVTIGFSWLKEQQQGWNAHVGSAEQDRIRERVGELPRRLLASLLLNRRGRGRRKRNEKIIKSQSSSPPEEPKAFIIHPSNSSTFAPETLLQAVLSLDRHRQRERQHDSSHGGDESASLLSRDEAITLLDTVHLLPVYDFPSAVQAISQVSDALHEIQRGRRRQQERQQQEEQDGNDIHPSSSEEDDDDDDEGAEQEQEQEPPLLLLIIEGLDSLTESTIRTSNPLRGSAVLMPVLRTLTHLSRTHAEWVSVMIVNNTLGLGGGSSHSITTPSDGNRNRSTTTTTGSDDSGLHSVFFRATGWGSGWGSGSGSLLPTLLSRTLDQGIDTHLMLSSVKGRLVVEVIKDRVGDSVGRWCVWQ